MYNLATLNRYQYSPYINYIRPLRVTADVTYDKESFTLPRRKVPRTAQHRDMLITLYGCQNRVTTLEMSVTS